MLPFDFVGLNGPNGYRPSLWCELGRSAQALLPTLLRHADSKGEAFPSEGRLAAMSGLTRKTVRSAAIELERREIVSISMRVSRAGRRLKVYRFLSNSADGIILPSIFIDGGNWAELTPAARSLSLAFRFFGSPRPDLDPDFGEWLHDDEWYEYLDMRLADYCNAEPVVLRRFAGIGPRVWSRAIKSLRDNSFIEPAHDNETYWRVLIYPPCVQSVGYLNSKIEGET
ncbi:helix-turn-helix domain-containing protein [Pseudodesulfovibrio sp. zrk46]|uniref:helix-turn-helix domain-containing protein n=1 Tax=Pseudodesulfovibrio sp. zrk46 TaxID=2725288 RepID=UPI00144A1205|nr:helix-turn-helix domain-containing protein [Pseudodesulfovibrio sp. zrk46]QJB57462.1 helix-turn-helix domain-containing protein [Pseudodesulfovibrio sp. zrk46]